MTMYTENFANQLIDELHAISKSEDYNLSTRLLLRMARNTVAQKIKTAEQISTYDGVNPTLIQNINVEINQLQAAINRLDLEF